MLPALDRNKQDWTNPYLNIPPEGEPHLILAGDGCRNVLWPDGTTTSCDEIKLSLNQPILHAWNTEGKALIDNIAYVKAHPEKNLWIVVDSGAYSAWSKGKKFDVDEYINFLNSNDVLKECFWAAEADVIPGSFGVDPTEEERLAAPEQSWQNYLYMIDRVYYPKKIVPIFHMGEDFKHLVRMLEFRFPDGDFIPYCGCSPRNDVSPGEKIKWLFDFWRITNETCARVGRKKPLIHNFGCTTISIIEQFPSCTSDSTSWLRSGAFGNIMLIVNGKTKTVYVSDRNPMDPDHILNQPLAVREAVEAIIHRIGHGLTLNDLIYNDPKGTLRTCFNIYSLNDWIQNMRYEGNNLFKESLWD